MIGALSTAFSGMRIFAAKADDAARDIVAAGLTGTSARETQPGGQVVPTPLQRAQPLDEPDLARGVVDLKQAEIGYKASVRLASVVSDMHKQLIDMLK